MPSSRDIYRAKTKQRENNSKETCKQDHDNEGQAWMHFVRNYKSTKKGGHLVNFTRIGFRGTKN
jgi:hypothetical protein